MPSTLPPGTITIGEHAYLIPSPAPQMTDCLVIAHGGTIDQTRKFDVPANLTVAFLAKAGDTYKGAGPMGVYQKLWAGGASVPRTQEYAQSRPCPDYILAKAMGGFWENEHEQANYV